MWPENSSSRVRFAPAELPNGTGSVRDAAVFDDGRGPSIYLAGTFSTIGGVQSPSIVRWDGVRLTPVGGGIDGGISRLVVFDDGSGSKLFAGGSITGLRAFGEGRSIATWDGRDWRGLGADPADWDGSIHAMVIHDDGAGPRLYVGGTFTTAGGFAASRIARWNGLFWQPLGHGLNDWVNELASYDDGNGPALYAAGRFSASGSQPLGKLARWTPAGWESVNVDFDATLPDLHLAVHDDGRGPRHFVGGRYRYSNDVPARGMTSYGPLGPEIIEHPAAVEVAAGEQAVLTVAAAGTGLSYTWRRDGLPLSEGGNISGAATDVLVIDPVTLGSAGTYDVLVQDGCGGSYSLPAVLTVTGGACVGDVNADGRTSFADIPLLLASFGSGPGGDLDGDADTDLDDLLVLLSDFCCGG